MPPGIFNTEEDVKASLEVLFLEYQYNCLHEKDPFACDGLASIYDVVRDEKLKAYALFAENCNTRKYGHSCHKIAEMCRSSQSESSDGPISRKHHFDWEKKGCDYGFPISCYNVGLHMTRQNGGMIPKAAFEHFVKACRGGQPPQACSRAVEYMQQHDLWNSESLELAKIGCEFNEKPACKAGADILNLGLGDIAINKRRARFFEKKLSYIEMASKSS